MEETKGEDYVTVITTSDFTSGVFPEMSIALPADLVTGSRNEGAVRAVSLLHYNVENLFPSRDENK